MATDAVTNSSVYPSGGLLATELGADIAACAGAVVDHDRLTQRFGKARRQQAREHVGAPARREGHDDTYRAAGKLLRADISRHSGQ